MNQEEPLRAAPPPRALPLALHVRILFGSPFCQFGWAFATFGMAFVFIFDSGGAIAEGLRFAGDNPTATGVSTGWERTNYSINDRRVYRTSFEYEVDGRRFTGASHETGSWVEVGSPVVVEYKASDPSTARITGFRTTPGGAGPVFILLFPIVGLGVAAGSSVRGMMIRNLLINGAVARGRLISTESTNVWVNGQPLMKLTFEFEAEGGRTYRTVARSNQPYRLEDEPHELLVYNPKSPYRTEMLDQLPSEPRFNEQGEVEESALGLPPPLYLLLPGVFTMVLFRYVMSLV